MYFFSCQIYYSLYSRIHITLIYTPTYTYIIYTYDICLKNTETNFHVSISLLKIFQNMRKTTQFASRYSGSLICAITGKFLVLFFSIQPLIINGNTGALIYNRLYFCFILISSVSLGGEGEDYYYCYFPMNSFVSMTGYITDMFNILRICATKLSSRQRLRVVTLGNPRTYLIGNFI